MPNSTYPTADFTQIESVEMSWGTLAYRRTGTGKPLVLLHSLALNGLMWEPIVSEIAVDHQAIIVDMRGHGASCWDGSEFSVNDLASDLHTLLDELELDQIDLLGLSMGGSVALTFAALWPTRCERLALCDTTAWYGPTAPKSWAERAQSVLNTTDRSQLLDFQLDRWFTEAFRSEHPQSVAHIAEIFVATDPRAHAQACLALGAMDSRELLGAITAKTVIITGEEDYATPPAMGEELGRAIAGSKFHIWPQARHLSPFESPSIRAELVGHLTI